jgi:16S rRNA (guanine(527)-N(7))-methyltransferase RsmG
MSDLLTHLAPALAAAGISLAPVRLEGLDGHFRLLLEWNARMNLTGVTDPQTAATIHYLDALAALPHLQSGKPVETWIDVGSGGGFPGVPLATAWPDQRFLLAESRMKKANFLQAVVTELGFSNRVAVFAGRVERATFDAQVAPHVARGTFGVCARALEKMDRQMWDLLKLPGVRRAAFWLGADAARAAAANAPSGWRAEAHMLPSGDRRALAVFRRSA